MSKEQLFQKTKDPLLENSDIQKKISTLASLNKKMNQIFYPYIEKKFNILEKKKSQSLQDYKKRLQNDKKQYLDYKKQQYLQHGRNFGESVIMIPQTNNITEILFPIRHLSFQQRKKIMNQRQQPIDKITEYLFNKRQQRNIHLDQGLNFELKTQLQHLHKIIHNELVFGNTEDRWDENRFLYIIQSLENPIYIRIQKQMFEYPPLSSAQIEITLKNLYFILFPLS
jgi:hypothetical protein